MTPPDNIKEEIEQEARLHANERCPGMDDTDIVYSMCADDYIAGATKFYERGVADLFKHLITYQGLDRGILELARERFRSLRKIA